MRLPPGLLICAALMFSTGVTSYAQTVWSDFYTGQLTGAFPAFDYPGGAAGPDYTSTASSANAFFVVDGAIGNGAPSLAFTDIATGAADAATLTVTMDNFAPFTVSPDSPTPILQVSFDIRIDSYLASSNIQNARFILRADNTNATGSQLVIGFGFGGLDDGDAVNDLALFADTQTGTTTSLAPKVTTAIGINAGVGWQPGFDFGNYDSVNSPENDTNDEFYRVTFNYNAITGGISGNVTRLSDGTTASLPSGLSLTAGKTFSNDVSDRFLISSSAQSTGSGYFDNITFQAVPEPGSGAFVLGGIAMLFGRRRKA